MSVSDLLRAFDEALEWDVDEDPPKDPPTSGLEGRAQE